MSELETDAFLIVNVCHCLSSICLKEENYVNYFGPSLERKARDFRHFEWQEKWDIKPMHKWSI